MDEDEKICWICEKPILPDDPNDLVTPDDGEHFEHLDCHERTCDICNSAFE